MRIGFIGLGRMGAPMAARLLPDHELAVFDVSKLAAAPLIASGANFRASPAEVGADCDILFASLPSPQIVVETLLAATANGGPRIVVDLSTSGAQAAIRLADELGNRGIASFDAPVSGGIKGAREGTLALMASGPTRDWDVVRPLLERFGKPFYMGERPGAGQTMKLVNNLLGAVAIAVTSEGMAMGIKAGLDPATMIDVLNQSTGRNSATQDKWPRSVLPRTFEFGFAAALSLKDTRLGIAEAEALGMDLPLGRHVEHLLERVLREYGQDADFTAIAKVVEKDAGLDPERIPPI